MQGSFRDIVSGETGARLVGRVWSAAAGGPCLVLVDGAVLRDITALGPTMSALLERPDLVADLSADLVGDFPVLGAGQAFLDGAIAEAADDRLLAPIDLATVKAAGVTFAISTLERVVEERADGDPARAEAIRAELRPVIGDRLDGLVPGSEQAAELQRVLTEMGLWSQYLEVAIGPDAEIFTKCPSMAAVGCGARIGLHPKSEWNNPEPEVVIVVNAAGRIVGATLGNDVNLRDFEGRSALLLSKAKDNNASAALGPFIRLIDGTFPETRLMEMSVGLTVTGDDGFHLEDASHMAQISRSPGDLAGQMRNRTHQYPDGAVLYLGTMFAPGQDRDGPGLGFTHHAGDIVTIAAPEIGRLVNRVDRSDVCPEWTFGIGALMRNLSARGLL